MSGVDWSKRPLVFTIIMARMRLQAFDDWAPLDV